MRLTQLSAGSRCKRSSHKLAVIETSCKTWEMLRFSNIIPKFIWHSTKNHSQYFVSQVASLSSLFFFADVAVAEPLPTYTYTARFQRFANLRDDLYAWDGGNK